MDNVLKNFIDEIDELKKHIDYIKNVNNSISNLDPLFSYINSSTKKKFNYKSLIISLYGIIEFYSENFLIKYLEEMNKIIPVYNELKQKIRDTNLINSANLTLKVIENKHHKYNSLNAEDIIINLNSCLTNINPYTINYPSFTLLSGNLKHSKICDLFKQIDINIELQFNQLTDFKNISSENKYHKIDDIVDRRNEIAHGALNNILDISEFPDYVDFIEKYYKSLYQILKFDIEQEKLKYSLKYNSIEFENVKTFQGNIIGFINVKKLWIRKSDKIIIKKSDGELSIAKIISLKPFKGTNELTLKLKPKTNLRDNQKFYLYRK